MAIRMKSLLKVFGVVLFTLITLGVIAVFIVSNTDWGRAQLQTRVLAALQGSANGTVSIGRLEGNLLTGVRLHDLSITDSSGAPFLTVREVRAKYGLLSTALNRRIELENVLLDHPVIVLEQNADQVWNYERIFPSDTTAVRDTTRLQFGEWLVLRDAQIIQGSLTVRMPWEPESGLTATEADSVRRFALSGDSREVVERTGGGLQKVQRFEQIDALFPLMRIAHPEYATRRFEVDSLRMRALAFAPPAADVRQLSGTFETDPDSVWFTDLDVRLPASSATLSGRYTIANGDLALAANAQPVAFDDVRFLYPPLPEDGSAQMQLAVLWANGQQRYDVRDLTLTTGGSRVDGNIGITLGDTLLIHETDVTFSGVTTALIEQLVPGVDVPASGLLSGSLAIDGSMLAMQVDGEVIFVDERSGRSRVLAVGEIGSDEGVLLAKNLRISLSPMQVALARNVAPDFPLGGVLTGQVTLDGSTASRMNVRGIDLTHSGVQARSRFTGTGAVRLGDVTVLDLDLLAQPLSLLTVGVFAPEAGLRGSVRGPIRVRGPLGDLAINSTLRTSDGGTISAVGNIDLESEQMGYALRVGTILFNANELVETAPVTSLSAEASAVGRGFEPATMRAELFATVSTSTLDTVAVDSARARIRIAEGMATIDTLMFRAPGTYLNAVGTFGLSETATGSLRYSAEIDSLHKLARYLPIDTSIVEPRPAIRARQVAVARGDSARTAQRLRVARAAGVESPAEPIEVEDVPGVPRDSLAGALRANGTLSGGLGGFDTRGDVEAVGLLVLGNSVRQARAQYEWLGALTDSSALSGTLSADTVSAAGFALDSVSVKATYRTPGGSAELAVYQDSDRDYRIAADYALFADSSELLFNRLQMRFDSTQWASTRASSVRWGQPGVAIDSIDLRNADNGRIFVNGLLPTDGAANLDVLIQRFQLGDLLGLLQSDVQGRGLLSINTALTGTTSAPVITGTAEIDEAMYAGSIVPNMRSRFDYAERELTARADATYVDRDIAVITGTIPINLALTSDTASRILDGPAVIDLQLDSLPLGLASRFTDVISQIEGYTTGAAALRGTLKEPDLTGQLMVAMGRGRLNPLGVTFRDLTGAIRMVGDSIIIDSLTARSGGTIALRGSLGIETLSEPSFNLRLIADNARVLDNELGRANADAEILMEGPFANVLVNGRARIREGIFYIPEKSRTQAIDASDPAVFAVTDPSVYANEDIVTSSSKLVENLRMNLRLAVDRNTWVRSNEANVEIYSENDLRINIDQRSDALALDGVVNTDRGEYEFLSKRFQIKRGTATFIGTNELNPLLQLTGEVEVKQAAQQALSIRVLIGGTMLDPRVALESDAQPPISQSDLLSYLAFGSESGSLLQFGGSSVSGGNSGGGLVGTSAALATRQLASVALGVAVKELEGSASRSLGADVFNITPAAVPTEIASGNFGAFETFLKGTQFEFGKYVTAGTFVGLQTQISSVPGFRVEHRFRGTPGLSIESTFQPRFFLPEPSLSAQDLRKANALGFFLTRIWRF